MEKEQKEIDLELANIFKQFVLSNYTTNFSDADELGGEGVWTNIAEQYEGSNALQFSLDSESIERDFDCMAFDENPFIDMHMREVVLSEVDADEYVRNTNELILSTVTDTGEVVGLPIDVLDHQNGDAAGWITSVYKDVNNFGEAIIRAKAEWNSTGIGIIKNKLRRSFSPTVSITKKQIRGGSLTNWPASIDSITGRFKLRPIQLSSGSSNKTTDIIKNGDDKMFEMKELVKDTEFQALLRGIVQEAVSLSAPIEPGVDETTPAATAEELIEMFDLGGTVEGINDSMVRAYQQKFQEIKLSAENYGLQAIARINREENLRQLCNKAVAGENYAVSVEEDKLFEFSKSLNTQQEKFFRGFLQSIMDEGVVDLQEYGHNKRVEELLQLPEHYANSVREGRLTLADLSNPIIGLDLAKYDVSSFA